MDFHDTMENLEHPEYHTIKNEINGIKDLINSVLGKDQAIVQSCNINLNQNSQNQKEERIEIPYGPETTIHPQETSVTTPTQEQHTVIETINKLNDQYPNEREDNLEETISPSEDNLEETISPSEEIVNSIQPYEIEESINQTSEEISKSNIKSPEKCMQSYKENIKEIGIETNRCVEEEATVNNGSH